MAIVITNIKSLLQTETKPILFRAGEAMKNLPKIDNAYLIV